MKVSLDEFNQVVKRAIAGYGYTESEVATIHAVLMYAQMRGNNQGVVKLIGAGIPRDPEAGTVSVAFETEVSALIDGARNHAMVVVDHAVDVALAKASEHGIAVVGVNHLNTSSGAIGCYARRIAHAGLIGIVFAGASPTVAPEGSYEARFGTNPLAIAVPSTNGPVVLDMATAAMARYGVIEAKTAGRALPPNIAYDDEGRLTTDPEAALNGALRTFDQSAKGSGLSFMVQALAGPLVGAAFAGIGDVAGNWGGHLVIALDPQLLVGRERMADGIAEMVGEVKSAAPLPGVEEIAVPGEMGDRRARAVTDAAEIEVEDNLYEQLLRVSGVPGS
jgi:L-2-hydroxycarboxylate dehydrogenase (NAD+)